MTGSLCTGHATVIPVSAVPVSAQSVSTIPATSQSSVSSSTVAKQAMSSPTSSEHKYCIRYEGNGSKRWDGCEMESGWRACMRELNWLKGSK